MNYSHCLPLKEVCSILAFISFFFLLMSMAIYSEYSFGIQGYMLLSVKNSFSLFYLLFKIICCYQNRMGMLKIPAVQKSL